MISTFTRFYCPYCSYIKESKNEEEIKSMNRCPACGTVEYPRNNLNSWHSDMSGISNAASRRKE